MVRQKSSSLEFGATTGRLALFFEWPTGSGWRNEPLLFFSIVIAFVWCHSAFHQ